ncbi:1582_t:CDS:1, partial [Dentiscutata heterogama]
VGYYGVETGRGIIDWAIKLKLPTYLRIALDDKSETVILAAVNTMSAWIIGGSKEFYQEEKLWERASRLYRGCEFVSLGGKNNAQTKKYFGIEISDYEAEGEYDTMETHAELASKDLIAGLISMDITHRLLYLLESANLPRVTNEKILLMFVRFARHSRKTAKIIFECHQLLDFLHKKYLCVAWPPINDSSNGPRYPNLMVAKLIHVLCQSSKKISKELINRYMNTFLRYVAINPASFSNEFEMAIGYNFFQETLCIYQTLATYGLYHEIFSQTYGIVNWYLVREILYSLTPPWEWKNSDDYQMRQKLGIAISFFRLLEIWIRVQDTEPGIIKECGAQPSEIIRDSVDFLANWMNTFSSTLLSQNKDIHEDYEKALNLISSVTKYIAAWFKYLGEHNLKDISEIQRIWEKLCLASWPSSHLCNYLRDQLINWIQNTQKVSRDDIWQISNLSGAYHPSTFKYISESLSISIIYDTYLSYVSLICQTCQLLSSDNKFSLKAFEMIKLSIPIEPLQLYAVKNPVKDDWLDFFNKMHIYLLYELMIVISVLIDNIGTNEIKAQNLMNLLHDALIIMPNILPGDEKMALDVLGRIVDGICSRSPDASMSECINILMTFYEHRIVTNNNNQENNTLLWNYGALDGLPLSKNWIWTPVDVLYSKKSDLVMETEVRTEITRSCLTLVCEVMNICKNITSFSIAKYIMDPIIIIISIMKIFMLDGEIYRMPDIEQRIEKIISSFTFQQSSADNIKFTKQVLEDTTEVLVVPFYQFFTDFSAAYAAGSYGNKSFAQLLILPLSSTYSVDFKHRVWSDLYDILGTIGIEYKDVICLEPLNSYFWPLESNTSMLLAYVGAVIHCKVTREKTPFMYWLAIHHLNGYVFFKDWKEVNENNHKKRIDISNAIIKSKKSAVISDWIKYTSRNFGEEVGELVKMPQCFMEVEEEVQHRIEIIKTFKIEFDE